MSIELMSDLNDNIHRKLEEITDNDVEKLCLKFTQKIINTKGEKKETEERVCFTMCDVKKEGYSVGRGGNIADKIVLYSPNEIKEK